VGLSAAVVSGSASCFVIPHSYYPKPQHRDSPTAAGEIGAPGSGPDSSSQNQGRTTNAASHSTRSRGCKYWKTSAIYCRRRRADKTGCGERLRFQTGSIRITGTSQWIKFVACTKSIIVVICGRIQDLPQPRYNFHSAIAVFGTEQRRHQAACESESYHGTLKLNVINIATRN
jgi:hypothetical protein